MFRYYTGEEVRVGDVVLTGNVTPAGNKVRGVVEQIILPGTREAQAYLCPEGGLLIKEDWDGESGYIVFKADEITEPGELIFVGRAEMSGS